ncbi:unnamed protein product [Brassica rapa subsp. trilocularis]
MKMAICSISNFFLYSLLHDIKDKLISIPSSVCS